MFPMNRHQLWLETGLNGDVGRVRRELDQAFRGLLGQDSGRLAAAAQVPLSAWENDDHFMVELDVPGMAETDVDLTVHDGKLYIRWSRPAPEGRTYLYNGRRFGQGEHVLALPEGASHDGIDASISHGVLALRIPKAAEAKPRKIEVRKSDAPNAQ